MLAVNALDVDINGTPILRGIGLDINSGEIIGLIGRNGAGKTTFLRAVMGLLPVFGGSIRHKDLELKDLPGYRRAHMGFGYMPEDRRLVPEMTAEQNILVPVWSTDMEGYESDSQCAHSEQHDYSNVSLFDKCSFQEDGSCRLF